MIILILCAATTLTLLVLTHVRRRRLPEPPADESVDEAASTQTRMERIVDDPWG